MPKGLLVSSEFRCHHSDAVCALGNFATKLFRLNYRNPPAWRKLAAENAGGIYPSYLRRIGETRNNPSRVPASPVPGDKDAPGKA